MIQLVNNNSKMSYKLIVFRLSRIDWHTENARLTAVWKYFEKTSDRSCNAVPVFSLLEKVFAHLNISSTYFKKQYQDEYIYGKKYEKYEIKTIYTFFWSNSFSNCSCDIN